MTSVSRRLPPGWRMAATPAAAGDVDAVGEREERVGGEDGALARGHRRPRRRVRRPSRGSAGRNRSRRSACPWARTIAFDFAWRATRQAKSSDRTSSCRRAVPSSRGGDRPGRAAAGRPPGGADGRARCAPPTAGGRSPGARRGRASASARFSSAATAAGSNSGRREQVDEDPVERTRVLGPDRAVGRHNAAVARDGVGGDRLPERLGDRRAPTRRRTAWRASRRPPSGSGTRSRSRAPCRGRGGS